MRSGLRRPATAAAFVLLAVAVGAPALLPAPPLSGADDTATGVRADSQRKADAASPGTERERPRAPLALKPIPRHDSTPGVLLWRHPFGGPVLDWVPDAANGSVVATVPAPGTMLDAAAGAGGVPKVLELVDNRTVGIRPLGANASEELELAGPGQAILTKDVHYAVTASGAEVVGYVLLENAAPLVHGAWLHVRAPGGGWARVMVPPPSTAGWSEVRGMEVAGDAVHLLVVGPAGTFYARYDAAEGAFDVAPELVLAPKAGSGVALAAAADGRAAILAAESQEESEAAARGAEVLGARVAVRGTDGAWRVSHVGRTYQGAHGDIRVEPTLRVLLYDWRAEDTSHRYVVYAPPDNGSGAWRDVLRFPDAPAYPSFLPGTPYVIAAPRGAGTPAGYVLLAVE